MLENNIAQTLDSVQGKFAVAYVNLHNPADTLYINADENFHAASTMKTPVMIEVYKQAAEGKFSLDDSMQLINEFSSIVDGSPYHLEINDDSGEDLYRHLGEPRTVRQLVYDMITYSSNLATNLLIDKVGAANVNNTMRQLGAQKIQVLRGVEDKKAFRAGKNNTVTARDLALIFGKIADHQAASPLDCKDMEAILLDQKFNDIIPALLPREVRVAHKTGNIGGVHHDSGIVYLPNGRRYVLIVLSKNLADFNEGTKALAQVSKLVYEHAVQEKK